MYAFFRIEGWPDTRAACLHLLEQTRVGFAPGELFASPGWMRMCVCRNAGQLASAFCVLGHAEHGKVAAFRHALDDAGLPWALGIPPNQKVFPPDAAANPAGFGVATAMPEPVRQDEPA